MKILLFLLFSLSVSAQTIQSTSTYFPKGVQQVKDYTGEPPALDKNKIGGLHQKQSNHYQTNTLVYLLGGTSIAKINQRKETASIGGFGLRTFSNNIIYGTEYNLIFNNNFSISNLEFNLGYQPNWRYKIKPFASLGLGTSKLKDETHNADTSGFNQSLNLGFTIRRNLPFHIISGMKYNFYNYKSEQYNANSQSFYVIIGFEF